MSRTRSTTSFYQDGNHHIHNQTLNRSEDPYRPLSYGQIAGSYGPGSYESITDELDSTGQRLFQDVSHTYYRCAKMLHEYKIHTTNGNTFDMSFWHHARYVPNSGDIPSPDWNQLYSDLADKLNGRIDNGSLAFVTLAEARKTWQMVRNPFSLLKPDWRPRVRRNSLARLASKSANIWLEQKYGWQSCYQDLKNFSKTFADITAPALDQFQEEHDQRYSVTTDLYWTGPTSYSDITWNDEKWADRVSSYLLRGDTVCRATNPTGMVTYRLGCMQREDLAQRWSNSRRFLNAFGLDASSILTTLWELVPYSFVVDWFVNPQGIWNYPAALKRLLGRDVYNLGYSKKVVHTTNLTYHSSYVTSYTCPEWVSWIDGQFCSEPQQDYYKTYERHGGLPSYNVFASAFAEQGLSVSQLLSGASLLIQRALQ